MQVHHFRKGIVMILSMLFLATFSAFAIALSSMSGSNVQVADNQRKALRALASAESGLEISRFWLSHVTMPSSTPSANYFGAIVAYIQGDLNVNGITNMVLQNDGCIPSVSLGTDTGETFSVSLTPDGTNPSVLVVSVTGYYGQVTRTVQVRFNITPYEHPIFNYGMATKGPIDFMNNPTTVGITDNWEADIYTESSSDTVAFHVGGNTNFDGKLQIANPIATVDFEGDVIIAGDHGTDAIDNHVEIGVPPVDFPTPDTQRFVKYATGPVLDSSVNLTKGITLTNVTIPAGMNPTFDGTVTIQGILLVESPNVVNFGSNVALQGIIVAQGDIDNPGTDQINVAGNFATSPYPTGADFDEIRGEIGTSLLTPGFSASFTGNYSSIEGVIASSGLLFSGNASAVLKGSVINYADTTTRVEGNVVMNFDRVASTKIPAGFDTHRVLDCDPSSYSIVVQ
ncbi:pilus assembly PilX N-terminal domain-containing protein [Planctomycetota bacterium]